MIKKLYHYVVGEQKRIALREQWQRWNAWKYKGNRVACNCCQRSFSRFLPKGNWTVRKEAVCPYCGSLERTRVLLFYLENETSVFTQPTRMLHFAPETSLKKILSQSPNIDYTDADINPALASVVLDIQAIAYEDDTFDCIICSHVLGHVPDEQQAIQEMRRVLKPDGLALVLTFIDPNREVTYEDPSIETSQERLEHYSEPDLLRLHGRDFGQRLAYGKFEVETIDYAAQLGPDMQQKYKLGNGDRELIFKCKK